MLPNAVTADGQNHNRAIMVVAVVVFFMLDDTSVAFVDIGDDFDDCGIVMVMVRPNVVSFTNFMTRLGGQEQT